MAPLGRRAFVGGSVLAASMAGHAWAQGATHDTVSLAMDRDIQGALDPADRLSFTEGNIIRAVCQGLIEFKPGTFEWQPAAAQTIHQDSPTVISFTLKPGLQFQGGYGELTANDVKFSFERFLQKLPSGKLPVQTKDWEALDHVEVTDAHSGRIILKHPAPALWLVVLPDISGCLISQKAYQDGAYQSGKTPLKLIGTGAYQFGGWVPNQHVLLQAYPGFKGTPAAFREVALRPVRDPKTAELALRSGELQFTRLQPASAKTLQGVSSTKTLSQDSINFVWIGINVQKPPFDNLKLRQAIRAAIDVDQVLAGAYDGAVGRAYGPIAPGLLGNWKDAPRYRQDIAQAKQLLQESGVGSGLRPKLTLLNQPEYQSAGQIVQAMLAEAGIQLDLDIRDAGSFWSAGSGDAGKELELSLQRFGGKADPAFQMQWFVTSEIGDWNWQRWSNQEYDTLFQQADATDDPTVRAQKYIRMQQLMDESSAFIWLTHERNVFGFADWLKPALLPNGDDMLIDGFTRA
jgi:peptide/nickel transport system substrate-binding protein